jgi:hypothetical protein
MQARPQSPRGAQSRALSTRGLRAGLLTSLVLALPGLALCMAEPEWSSAQVFLGDAADFVVEYRDSEGLLFKSENISLLVTKIVEYRSLDGTIRQGYQVKWGTNNTNVRSANDFFVVDSKSGRMAVGGDQDPATARASMSYELAGQLPALFALYFQGVSNSEFPSMSFRCGFPTEDHAYRVKLEKHAARERVIIVESITERGRDVRDSQFPCDGQVLLSSEIGWPLSGHWEGVAATGVIRVNFRLIDHHDGNKQTPVVLGGNPWEISEEGIRAAAPISSSSIPGEEIAIGNQSILTFRQWIENNSQDYKDFRTRNPSHVMAGASLRAVENASIGPLGPILPDCRSRQGARLQFVSSEEILVLQVQRNARYSADCKQEISASFSQLSSSDEASPLLPTIQGARPYLPGHRNISYIPGLIRGIGLEPTDGTWIMVFQTSGRPDPMTFLVGQADAAIIVDKPDAGKLAQINVSLYHGVMRHAWVPLGTIVFDVQG